MNFKNSITTIESLQKQLLEAPFEREMLNSISEDSGLYALWWVDDFELLTKLNRDITFQGKAVSKADLKKDSSLQEQKFIFHDIKWDWGLEEKTPLCLYVGKTTNLQSRLNLHFMYNVPNWYKYSIASTKMPQRSTQLLKHTTSCQMRAGIEHLFKNKINPKTNQPYTFEEKLKNLRISVLPESCFKERFYLEDLAIGYFRPWFNLDSER